MKAPAISINGRAFGDRVLLALVILLSIVMIAPVLWVIGLSLKENAELMANPNSVFQAPYTLKNYINTIGTSSVFVWVFNSIIVSGGLTLGTLILSSLAGYGFARLNFPGRNILFVTVLILPGLSASFGVFLMTQYFKAIPKELDEAALLDNASRFRIFWKVLLPLTVPAQATLGIFTFLGAWNDYLWPLISATKKDMYTLTVGMASTQTNFAQSEGIGFLMAQAVFAGAPILIVYLFFQKYIVTAVSGAAVR